MRYVQDNADYLHDIAICAENLRGRNFIIPRIAEGLSALLRQMLQVQCILVIRAAFTGVTKYNGATRHAEDAPCYTKRSLDRY